jgi:hypothetical protein
MVTEISLSEPGFIVALDITGLSSQGLCKGNQRLKTGGTNEKKRKF